MDYVDREIPKEGEWLKVRYLLRSLQEDIHNKRSKLKFKIILKIQSNLFRTASSRFKSSLVDLEMLTPKTDRPILIRNRNRGEDPIAPPISTTCSTRARRGRGSRSAKITRGFRSSVPRRDADGVRRHSSFLAVWYHVPCWLRSNTHTHAIRDLRILVELHYALPYVTAYPVAPHPPTGFVPAPTQPPTYGVAGAAPYGVFPNQPQLYATQGPPPPTYDQTLTHPMMYQPMYGQGYPLQYYPPGYPLQYYPPLAATTAYYPTMQPAPVRPTIMVPNGFDGTRFDGISQPVLPPPPPGVAANAAQLAAMAGHSVALSQKKGSFLGGGTEGGYTFW